jgi:uncharacterized protein YjbJ (UPF0337 family)
MRTHRPAALSGDGHVSGLARDGHIIRCTVSPAATLAAPLLILPHIVSRAPPDSGARPAADRNRDLRASFPLIWMKEHSVMNWQQVEGNWKQLSGKLRERWGKLTDNDLQTIAGHRDQLIGRIQSSYGIAKEEAEKQVREFEHALDARSASRH